MFHFLFEVSIDNIFSELVDYYARGGIGDFEEGHDP